MKTLFALIFIISSGLPTTMRADQPENGTLTVYAAYLDGRTTASGEIYQRSALTAAHESLPFGTIVRIANFKAGKMVDVRINDRKPADGRVLNVSEGAARKLEIASDSATSASYLVMGMAVPRSSADEGGGGALSGLFGGGKSKSNTDVSSSSVNVPQAQRPAAAEPQKDSGFSLTGLFGGSGGQAVPASSYPTQPTGVPSYAPQGELVPLNAVAPASVPAPEAEARPQSSSVLPGQPAAAPYRAQFGAYRRSSNAYDTSGVLTRSGVGNMVVQSPVTNLFLVVTSAGFSTAYEAQHWIDTESARRGWRERPVVIR
mgnify:CR=1 FL=1